LRNQPESGAEDERGEKGESEEEDQQQPSSKLTRDMSQKGASIAGEWQSHSAGRPNLQRHEDEDKDKAVFTMSKIPVNRQTIKAPKKATSGSAFSNAMSKKTKRIRKPTIAFSCV
jgi:hypothetical protein